MKKRGLLIHGIVCKKCKKIISRFNYEPEKDVYIKCCNKKRLIGSEEVSAIQNFNYKCPECNQKIECFYIDRKCPNCGEINTEKKIWRKPTSKQKRKNMTIFY